MVHINDDCSITANAATVRPTGPIMDEVRDVITELADEIEAEVEARRGAVLPRITERDLEPVRRARALLTKLEGHGG